MHQMAKRTPEQSPTSGNTFTADELVMINNALNEVCHGVDFDDDELQARVGFTREQLSALLAKVSAMVKKSK
jgi:hypothetical protein